MHLTQIKLFGFKSFADATTIPVQSNLTAIVGPNGCGKSNVIDAVRWVVGELSAKQLRGQSMTDVIFNGAGQRQPAGKAAVELHFDNSDGQAGGQFAGYAELIIRREVTRDGQSNYYLNNRGCRRKDIVDVFLGTGLGPRSYAIIEQGMVSRLVEAKPEDLRVFVEEAAGISKYRERRRETENRIKHTKENLDRINDLCSELQKQLSHLERQAKAAEKYKVLKSQESTLQLELATMRWQKLNETLTAHNEKVHAIAIKQEQCRTELGDIEKQFEQLRLNQVEATDNQQTIQRAYYKLGAEIARIEQQIKHYQQQVHQWELELDQTTSIYQELKQNTEQCQQQVADIERELADLTPQQGTAEQAKQQAVAHLQDAEASMQRWQEQWEHVQQGWSASQRSTEVSKTKLEQYQRQLDQAQQRLTMLEEQQSALSLEALERQLQPLSLTLEEAKAKKEEFLTTIENKKKNLALSKEKYESASSQLLAKQKQLNQLEAQYHSLKKIQDAALHRDNKSVEWLKSEQLDQAERMAETLDVEQGWENAVEIVLGQYLDAVAVNNLADYSAKFAELDGAELTLFESAANASGASSKLADLVSLAAKVKANWNVAPLLQSVFVAQDLYQALSHRDKLAPSQSIITPQGYWLGANWLKVATSEKSEDSVLLRKKELGDLQEQLQLVTEEVAQYQAEADAAKQQLQGIEQSLETEQQAQQEAVGHWSDAKSAYDRAQVEFSNAQSRQQQLSSDIAQLHQQIDQLKHEKVASEDSLQQATDQSSEQQQQRDELLQERDRLRETLKDAREAAASKREFADQLGIRIASNENQLALLKQTLTRDARQLEQVTTKRSDLKHQLQENDQPTDGLQTTLQSLLDERIAVEQQLKDAEQASLTIQQQINELDDRRQTLNQTLLELQTNMQNLQVARQTTVVNQENLTAEITRHKPVEEAVNTLSEGATIPEWEQQLEQVDQSIRRLGAINLAAIEEKAALAERKEYLDQQQADLIEALDILENAIKKIDKETRHTFKETFDQVNSHFAELFPKIFGGGKATLELQDDDLLVAGVLVKAQPPGKKNSTIHMLSGGEKALTAIALVFSFFRLNPAPFCILDEVDAPLDDLNVSRYCQLIKEMAGEIQFLVISHNKVTIEAADELMGVTMQEAGVSRVVSVNMEQAVTLAE